MRDGSGTSIIGNPFAATRPAHLPQERIGAARTLASTGLRGEAYVEEVLRWLPEGDGGKGRRGEGETLPAEHREVKDATSPRPPVSPSPRPGILLADDNADMREYLRRLLAESGYEVEAVADGLAALRAARERPPELLLTDVMMPGLDGFGLLAALRAEERTRTLPVILLSARAGGRPSARAQGGVSDARGEAGRAFGAARRDG